VLQNTAAKAIECTLFSEQHGARILNFTGLATTLPNFSAVANTFAPYLPSTQHPPYHQAPAGAEQVPPASAFANKTFRYQRRLPQALPHLHPPQNTRQTRLTLSDPQAVSRRSKRAAVNRVSSSLLSVPSVMQAAREHTDDLFSRAYAGIYRCTPTQAREALREADQTLYDDWRDLSAIDQLKWTPAVDNQPRSAYDLASAAISFAAYRHQYPEQDEMAALARARFYLTQAAKTAADDSAKLALYQSVLQRGLHWIDLQKAHIQDLSATQILQTVSRHRHPDIANRNTFGGALAEHLQNERDVIVDEAALIAYFAWRMQIPGPDYPILSDIRNGYVSALIDEWQDAALGISLLPSSPVPPAHAAFYYDGAILQNARGKDGEQIADAIYDGAPYAEEEPVMQRIIDKAGRNRYLMGQPDSPNGPDGRNAIAQWAALNEAMHGIAPLDPRYRSRPETVKLAGVWLTREEVHAIVDKTMRNLMIDTVYPGGTTLHAVATTVLRFGAMHGIAFDRYHEPEMLIKAFNRLQIAWRSDPHFPVAPWICASHYLAQTGNVLFIKQSSPLSTPQQIALQLNADTLPAIREADGTAPKGFWNRTLEALLDAPHFQAQDIASIDRNGRRTAYEGLAARAQALAHPPETIFYEDSDDLNQKLEAYWTERSLAHAPYPVYDENFQMEWILREKLGMTDADLQTRKPILINPPGFKDTPLIIPNVVMATPLQQFKDHRNLVRDEITFNKRIIKPERALNAAKEKARASLLDNPIIIAKAKEMLRHRGEALDDGTIDSLRNAMADGIVGEPEKTEAEILLALLEPIFGSQTVTTIVNAIASGKPREMLGLLPFIIPLYDIEEGIRHRDWRLALEGALHFGADAIFVALGAGMEGVLRRQLARDIKTMALARGRMSPTERAGVNMMIEMTDLYPEVSPEQLRERRVTTTEDTFNVRATPHDSLPAPAVTDSMTQTEPEMPNRRLTLYNPDKRPQHTLYLLDERRRVPVERLNGIFVETDLRGKVIPDAPLIFGNLELGRGYRLNRKLSLTGATILEEADLLLRDTVADVLRYWKKLKAKPNIRVRRAEPHQLVRHLFERTDHPLFTEFKQFWQKAYARSSTAVAIMNAAYDSVVHRGNCVVEFDAPKATGCRLGTLCLLSDSALADKRFLSIYGETPFQRARMWVHEFLHWATGLPDAAAQQEHNHRGPTVYLTERILLEMGDKPDAQRLAYKGLSDLNAGKVEHRMWLENLRALHDLALAEDKYLDRELDDKRDFSAGQVILGQKITHRVTVRQGLALIRQLEPFKASALKHPRQLFQKVCSAFRPSPDIAHREFMERLITDSKTFATLAATWSSRQHHTPVTIRRIAFPTLEPWAWHMDFAHAVYQRKIWLNEQSLYYHSDSALSAMSPLRQYAGAVIEFFLDELIPSEQRLELKNMQTERGLAVTLENEVLSQIGDASPPRICFALTSNPQSQLHHQSAVIRVAHSENGFLRQQVRGGLSEKPIQEEDDILGLSNEAGLEKFQL
jgi:hypothetical protein